MRGAVPPTGCDPVLTCKYTRSDLPKGCDNLCTGSHALPVASSPCLCRGASAPVSSSLRRSEASEVGSHLQTQRRCVSLLHPKEGCSGRNKQSKWESYQRKIAVIFDSSEGRHELLLPGVGSDTSLCFALGESINFVALGVAETYPLRRAVLRIRCLLILLIFNKFKC